ncbi:MAG: CHAT domain-containing protein [Cyanobacteria bacterium P01_A01_bin.80]
MKLLKLFLTVPQRAESGEFQVNAISEAGQLNYPSKLPFFEDEKRWRTTIIKILGAVEFREKDFPDSEEQDWMLKNGLLVKQSSSLEQDGYHFSQQIQQIIGAEIYKSLFPVGEPRELLQRMLAKCDSQEQLHIQLGFSDKIEKRSRLPDYPWELAYDQNRFLVERQVVFSRFIGFLETTPKLSPVDRINILLVSSSAFDEEMELSPLGNQEQRAVLRALKIAEDKSTIQVKQLKSPTFKELGDYLTENTGEQAPNIIHFDGHGLFGQRCDRCRTIHKKIRVESCRKCGQSLTNKTPQGYLLFAPGEGEWEQSADYVSAREIGNLLQKISSEQAEEYGVRLVVLSACKTSFALANESLFNGLAQNLIQHQVPAVLAMQYNVTVDGATAFTERFYRAIGSDKSLITAVSLGQNAMGIEGNQWYRPVLYLRCNENEGGLLFDKKELGTTGNVISKDNQSNEQPNTKSNDGKKPHLEEVEQPEIKMTLKDLIKNGILNQLATLFNTQDMADVLLDTIDFPVHMRPVFPQSGIVLGYWRGICSQIQNGALASGNDLQPLVDAAGDIYTTNDILKKYHS